MNLKETFQKKTLPELMKTLKRKNVNSLPKLEKVKVNVGIGSYLAGAKNYSDVEKNLMQITGQKPVARKAKKAISNFKLRAGMIVGLETTLRKKRMYDFVSKLINVVLPRTRDFRGISKKGFDGHGNFSLGIREFTVFSEIHIDDIVKNHGIQVTIVTTAKNDEEGYQLLKTLGFPFKKEL